MKKVLFTLALAFAGMTMQAQTIGKLMQEFKDQQGVTYVKLDKSMISAMPEMGDKEDMDEAMAFAKALGENGYMEILSVENNKDAVKKLSKKLSKMNKEGYETMVNSNEEDVEAKIYTRSEGDKVKEMLIVAVEKDEMQLIRILGDIDFSKIGDIIN